MKKDQEPDNQEMNGLGIPTIPNIKKAPLREFYPVSLQQEGVWLQAQIARERTLWNSSYSWRFEGKLDIGAMEKSVQQLIRRHAALRTVFSLQGDKILQSVRETVSLDRYFRYIDISSTPEAEQEAEALRLEKDTAQTPYNLEVGPPARFTLVRFNENDHVMVIGLHHIISDMTSRQLLWKDLVALYNAEAANRPYDLEPVDIQYVDYAEWQREFLETPYYRAQKEYWLKELTGGDTGKIPVLDMPRDNPRRESEDPISGTRFYAVELNPAQAAHWRTFSLRKRQPFSALFLAAFYILLHKHSGQEDIVIGTMNQGRKIHKNVLKKIMGLFANQTAVRLQINEDMTLAEVLENTAQKIEKAYQNQEFLYEDLLRTLRPDRSERHAPVFQAVFNMIKVAGIDAVPEGHTPKQWDIYRPEDEISYQYDLSLYVRDEFKKITLRMLYTADRYREETIARYMEQYIGILTALAEDPAKSLAAHSIITPEEVRQILCEFNRTEAPYPRDKTIHQLFVEQTNRNPDRIALVSPHGNSNLSNMSNMPNMPAMSHLSYQELNRQAWKLAMQLKEKGLKPDTVAAIMLERSLEMIIGLYAILNAGAAYLPMDPATPEERIDYLMADSGAQILVTTETVKASCNISHSSYMPHDTSTPSGDELAYIIYTSGSTGKPKGVMVEHRSVVNILYMLQRQYPVKPNDSFLLKTSYMFDVSAAELFGWYWEGGRLTLLEKGGEKNPESIIKAIERESVTHINFVPSMFSVFVDLLEPGNMKRLSSLKHIFLAGEALLPGLVERYRRHAPEITLENLYGPTEATIYASYYSLSQWEGGETVPIGKPVANNRLYILDRNDALQPLGVAGELIIQGVGLARGYLNRPELTSEKFTFNSIKLYRSHTTHTTHTTNTAYNSNKIYRTGDLARWQSDGNIEFLGRIDHQVKIRGYRIELGEIETTLNKHRDIKESVVIPVKDKEGIAGLCAYIRTTAKGDMNPGELREYLSKTLPEYMIPTYFVKLERFPLNTSGKIDRKALPKPDVETGIRASSAYEAPDPQNDVQQKLTAVWQEVLGIPKIGINDNFFIIGGDSIKAIQIASRLNTYGIRLDISQIFKHYTIKALSKYVPKIAVEIDQKPVNGPVPLHPIQQWFIQRAFIDKHHWNLSFMLYRPEGFRQEILENVIRRLLEHHDMLRAVLAPEEETLIIKEIAETGNPLEVFHISTPDPEQQEKQILKEANRLQASIDLYNGPLLKVGLFKTPGGDHLLLALHHLVIDGVSWRILFEDLATGYEQAKSGQEIRYPAKTHSYRQWVQELSAYSHTRRLLGEIDYWKSICTAGTADFLPTTGPKPGKLKDYYRYTIELEEEDSRLLLNEANRAYHTEINDLLLCALSRALKECYGVDNPLVALEGHGREHINEDIDITRTVGWYTALYPVRLEAMDDDNPGLHIRRVKENLRKIPHKGIGYGILLYLADLPEAERHVLEIQPQIGFNYMGQFDEDLARGGFQRSPYSGGDTRSQESQQPYRININGIALQRKLFFTFSGDTQTLEKQTIETLAQTFQNRLKELIRHCAAQKEPVRTPSDFDAIELEFDDLDTITGSFGAGNISKIYEISPMQEGMLFHYLLDPHRRAYLVQVVYRLEGEINELLFKESCVQLIARYEIFRTAIAYKKVKKPRQVVLANREAEVYILDLSGAKDKTRQQEEIEEILDRDRLRGFDLHTDILIRIHLIKLNPGHYSLVITNQHLILDGWSTNLLLKNLVALYGKLRSKVQPVTEPPEPSESGEPESSYLDYIQWVKSRDSRAAVDYWRENLRQLDQVTRIPPPENTQNAHNIPDNEIQEYKKQDYTLAIPDEIRTRLSETAAQLNATVNNVLQAAWCILLQRCAGTDDIVFGNVISGRNIPLEGIERIMGLFINTIPMRVTVKPAQSVEDMTRDIRDTLLETQQYGFLPLGEIQAHANTDGPLLEHLYIYENYPVEQEIRSSRLAQKVGFNIVGRTSSEQTNYHLNILVIPREELLLRFQYNENRYPTAFVSRLAGHILYILEQVTKTPGQQVEHIEIITPEEKRQILEEFNETAAPYPGDITILELFARQVEQHPDRQAVVGPICNSPSSHISNTSYTPYMSYISHLSYKELNHRAGKLAVQLKEKGIRPDTVAAIMVERSLEMIIGIFAIMKAGGAYMPIDPHSPRDRIDYMMADSAAQTLVTAETVTDSFNMSHSSYVSYMSHTPHEPPYLPYPPGGALAYIIYTSGSTGKPKGVMIEQRPLVNRLNWMQKKYPIGRHDTILHKTPYTFDVSVWEIFWWSLQGARVCLLPPGGEKDPRLMVEAIQTHDVTVMHFVPSMLSLFLDYIDQTPGMSTRLISLRRVIASGEALSAPLVQLFNNLLAGQGTRLTNLYGPTEATIDVSYYDCPTTGEIKRIPIGKPIDNTGLWVLYKGNRLQPPEVAGELGISGDGLARGYLNRPELTSEKFIFNSIKLNRSHTSHSSHRTYPTYSSTKLYKTGDRVRQHPDGNIEFLDRIDNQVKIRGNRIELGEIQAHLEQVPGIKEAVVTAIDDTSGAKGVKSLCAYLVPDRDREITIAELRENLGQKLPAYMIPSYFVQLERIPLTPNGKIDRKALPGPDQGMSNAGEYTRYTPPTTAIEKTVQEIWQEILNNPKIGIASNFFELGGNSLSAMKMAFEIHKRLGTEIPLWEIFDNPTIALIARLIQNREERITKFDRILTEIENLDEDQVLEMLEMLETLAEK